LFWIPLASGIVSTALYKLTDNYYIIDSLRKKILFHFSFSGFTRETEKYSFDDVFCVMPNTIREHSRSRSWWSNYLTLLMKDGTFLRISDESTQYNSEDLVTTGKEMAAMISVPYHETARSVQMRVKNRPVLSMEDLVSIPAKKVDCEYIQKIFKIIAGTIVISFLIIILAYSI